MKLYILGILLIIGTLSHSNAHFQLPRIDLGPNPIAGLLVGAGQAVRDAGEHLKKVNPIGILHDVKHALGIQRPPHNQPPPQPPQEIPKAPPPEGHGGYNSHGHQLQGGNQGGYYPNQGYPQQGYPQQGYPNQGYPSQGYPNQQNGYPNQGYPGSGYPGYSGQNSGYPGGYPTQGYYPGYNPQGGYPNSGYPTTGYPSQGNSGYNQGQGQGSTGTIHNLGGPNGQNAGHGVFQGGANGKPTGTQGISTSYPGQNSGHGGHGVFQGNNYPGYPSGSTARPQGQQNFGYPGGSTSRPSQPFRPSSPGSGYPGTGNPGSGYPGTGYPESGAGNNGGQSTNIPYKPVVEGNIGESSYPGQNIFGGNKSPSNKPSNPAESGEFGVVSFGQSGTTSSPKEWSSETFGGQGNYGSTNNGKNEGNTGGYTLGKGSQGIKEKEDLVFAPDAEEGEYSFDLRMAKPK